MDESGAGGGGVHAGFKQRSNAVFKKYFGNWLPLYSFAHPILPQKLELEKPRNEIFLED